MRTIRRTPGLLAAFVACALGGSIFNGCSDKGGAGPPPPPAAISIKSISVFYSGNSSLNGAFAIAGQGSFTLLVNGQGFTNTSLVNWNGSVLSTQFGDSSDLAASVSSSLIAAPGKATITVTDSRASSNSLILPIASPAAATAGVVALITTASDGTAANGDSLVAPSISADGRYVAFQSDATNLAPGPASSFQEIYERDTCVGAPPTCAPSTIRITITYDGSPVNAHSRDSAISADGRYVAFDSQATNLIAGTAVCAATCVFLRDTCIGVPSGCSPSTTLISVASDGSAASGANPSMSADARFVAFNSNSANMVSGDPGGVGEAFVRDTCLGATNCTPSNSLVSVPISGTQDNATTGLSVMSANGRYFAFQSWATNIVANTTNLPGDFWRDTCLNIGAAACVPSSLRVDIAQGGAQPNNSVTSPTPPAITPDGRLVAFGSTATNLVSASVQGQANVYVRDLCTAVATACTPSTSLVSLANDGSLANCGSPGNQGGVSISADGRFVSFASIATNLTPDDNFPACSSEDIFVRDTCFGVTSGCFPSTVRASVANSPNPGISANAISVGNAMSTDAHYVVFISTATNLLPGTPGNGHAMVYLAKTGF